jgi:transglutaminase-like putative cysteine protease
VIQTGRRGWSERLDVTVRGLNSDLVVGAGTIYRVDGDAQPTATFPDGTYKLGDVLGSGDTYSVQAYVPDPSAAEMRGTERKPYEPWLTQYTVMELPGSGRFQVRFPLRGDPDAASGAAPAGLAGNAYEPVYRLARRVAAGKPTAYDVVKATERFLERRARYVERVPTYPDPLPAFLFRDRRGYCQHFSGAMALMLRMNGIPARVAGGFSPGTRDADTREFRVRDFDAHSWVEVWFPGIGWVPFDPTPAAAPARSQGDSAAASAARGGLGDRQIRRDLLGPDGAGGAGLDQGAAKGGTGPWPWIALGSLAVALAVGRSVWRRARRRRAHSLFGPDIDYLLELLSRLGFTLPPGVTLLALEGRVTALAGPHAARYVRRLRERRYSPRAPERPGSADRRALRRSLAEAAGVGPLARLQLGLWALFSALPGLKLARR